MKLERVGDPLAFCPLTDVHGEIIPLQYLNFEFLVWLFAW